MLILFRAAAARHCCYAVFAAAAAVFAIFRHDMPMLLSLIADADTIIDADITPLPLIFFAAAMRYFSMSVTPICRRFFFFFFAIVFFFLLQLCYF